KNFRLGWGERAKRVVPIVDQIIQLTERESCVRHFTPVLEEEECLIGIPERIAEQGDHVVEQRHLNMQKFSEESVAIKRRNVRQCEETVKRGKINNGCNIVGFQLESCH